MLSPGEMVMSTKATRAFASQLTAMNAGSKPSFHAQGGHVTNVGDINVSVEGGGTGRQTARRSPPNCVVNSGAAHQFCRGTPCGRS